MGEDGWSFVELDEVKCVLIKGVIELYCYKGMFWVVREVIWCLGFGEVEFVEGIGGVYYDGKSCYDSVMVYGGNGLWVVYWVILFDCVIIND